VSEISIKYPEHLPIAARVAEIKDAWRQHQVIIIGGDTGSGKTTQLPKIAMELNFGEKGRIGCTQPRRLAASAMSIRVAEELGCRLGDEVGFKVRFYEKMSLQTKLKFMTDGILLAETAHDRLLKQYSCLIIDEAHERSLNIDFILGYLKNLLPKRPDLKVAISSATLDVAAFAKFFHDAPVIEIEGRTFPIEDYYMEPMDADEELSEHVARGIEFASELDPRGDILVFLPGEREIRDVNDMLSGRKYPYTEILPLFGRLSAEDQQKIFHPGRLRRIILATNVAETSITISRIRFVVDSGLARIKRFNPRTSIEELQIEFISAASMRQRRGRCGRVADGVCIHLYSDDDAARAQPYTDPEIRRSALADVILQMAALNLPRIDRFPFLDPPPASAIREGVRTLEDLRAIDGAGRLTREGWQLVDLPLDPHLAKMIRAGERANLLPEMLVTAAFLSIQDPRERPAEKQQQADEAHRRFRDPKSDFLTVTNLWNALHREGGSNRLFRLFCRKNFLNFNRTLEWRNLVDELRESVNEKLPAVGLLQDIPYDLFHQSILTGIPRNIAKYDGEEQLFVGTGHKKYHIFPGSGLFKAKPVPEWLMSFALVETTRVFARQNAVIKPEYLERCAPHLCSKVYDQAYFKADSGFVYARERLIFGGLLIHQGRKVHYAQCNPAEAREIFIREGLAEGLVSLPGSWVDHHNQVLSDLANLEQKVRRPGTVLDREAVVEHYLTLLPEEINSTESIKKNWAKDKQDYSIAFDDAMQQQYGILKPEDYPDMLEFAGHKFQLEYRFNPGEEDDGITLVAPSALLNLLPGWALDYLVPGFLRDRVELLIKALPKHLRQAASPVVRTVDEFLASGFFAEQPLVDALADYLSENTGEKVRPDDFANVALPEFLVMKLAEITANGRRIIHREVPGAEVTGSRLSRSVAGVKKHTVAAADGWPNAGVMSETIELAGGKTGYVALCVQGELVGQAVFLREEEAAFEHRRGLIKLFRLAQANQLKFLKRTVRLPNEIMLSIFFDYRDFEDDLLDRAIIDTLDVDPVQIRDQLRYEIAEEQIKQNIGETLNTYLNEIKKLYQSYQEIKDLLPKAAKSSRGSADDVKEELSFLFAPGFLKRDCVFTDYARYLRGIKLRTGRIYTAPGKDEDKLGGIAKYIEHFRLLAAADGKNLERNFADYRYFITLAEARLAVFAPEVTLKIKNPVKVLDTL